MTEQQMKEIAQGSKVKTVRGGGRQYRGEVEGTSPRNYGIWIRWQKQPDRPYEPSEFWHYDEGTYLHRDGEATQ